MDKHLFTIFSFSLFTTAGQLLYILGTCQIYMQKYLGHFIMFEYVNCPGKKDADLAWQVWVGANIQMQKSGLQLSQTEREISCHTCFFLKLTFCLQFPRCSSKLQSMLNKSLWYPVEQPITMKPHCGGEDTPPHHDFTARILLLNVVMSCYSCVFLALSLPCSLFTVFCPVCTCVVLCCFCSSKWNIVSFHCLVLIWLKR